MIDEKPTTVPVEPAVAPLPPRLADPGMSDEAVVRATGKSWDEWLALLDAWGAAGRTHPEIATHLHEIHGVDGWWAQMVTVGYERARGMRAVHQHADGFSASASRTFPVPLDRLWRAFDDATTRARWLDAETFTPRSRNEGKSFRLDVPADGSRVAAWFTAKGPAKSAVAIEHSRLLDSAQVAETKVRWKARWDRLAAVLADDDAGA